MNLSGASVSCKFEFRLIVVKKRLFELQGQKRAILENRIECQKMRSTEKLALKNLQILYKAFEKISSFT